MYNLVPHGRVSQILEHLLRPPPILRPLKLQIPRQCLVLPTLHPLQTIFASFQIPPLLIRPDLLVERLGALLLFVPLHALLPRGGVAAVLGE